MTQEQLKAQAYDVLAQIQFLQKKLGELNEQIAAAQAKPEVKPEEKPVEQPAV